MKHILRLSLLLLIAQESLASPGLSGFYIKGGLGGTTAEFDVTQTLQTEAHSSIFLLSTELDNNNQVRGTNFAGLLGFGYAMQLNSLWVVSAEFTSGITSANSSFTNENLGGEVLTLPTAIRSSVTTTLTNDFALLIKPGLAIMQKTQFYALLGPRWGNFSINTDTSFSLDSPTSGTGGNGSSSKKDSAYSIGFTVGLGVERLLTDHWSLGLEYAYTAYGDIPSTETTFTTPLVLFSPPQNVLFTVTEETTATSSASNLVLFTSYRF